MKLTPQILLQNGWKQHKMLNKNMLHFTKKEISIYIQKCKEEYVSINYAPLDLSKYIDLLIPTPTVEKFNNLMDICNLQEFKLHADKPQKSPNGWIVNLDKFNIKAEYFKTAKMLKTWFLGFIRNVYKDDVLRLNNLQFEHVKDGRTVAYFTFKADTQTFSKIFKAN